MIDFQYQIANFVFLFSHQDKRVFFMLRLKPLLPAIFLLYGVLIHAQTVYTPDWKSLDTRPTPEWWQDAKFGIFIHWGVYSVPAFTPKGRYAEWYQNSLVQNDPDGKAGGARSGHGNVSYSDQWAAWRDSSMRGSRMGITFCLVTSTTST